MNIRILLLLIFSSLSLGLVVTPACAQTSLEDNIKSSDTEETGKPLTSQGETLKDKKPQDKMSQNNSSQDVPTKSIKSIDDLDAFFKKAEDEIKAGNHCFDESVNETPRQTDSKPIV